MKGTERINIDSNYRYSFNGKENDTEIKGDGNSVDFGARIYDPRLGRWLSVDPEYKQYPFASPYMAFGNNPNVFIDPGGETLRVATGVNREKVRAMLQKLTNDKVILQKDGLVTLVSSNQNPGKKLTNGTQLLRDVVSHEKEIEIFKIDLKVPNSSFNPSGESVDPREQYNGVGIGGYIMLGQPTEKLEYDPASKKSKMVEGDMSITLSGELIHGLKSADGNVRKPEWLQESSYKDQNGILQTEIQQREELETHGIGGSVNINKNGKAYVNENDIRKEQNLNQRTAYSTEFNTNSNGDSYKQPKNKK